VQELNSVFAEISSAREERSLLQKEHAKRGAKEIEEGFRTLRIGIDGRLPFERTAMPKKKQVTLSQLQNFIRRRLKTKLQQDLRDLRIVKEADLECASYYFIRRFLGTDKKWVLLTRKHVIRTGHYIDMLIFRKGLPRIAIEFKWNLKQITRKDRRSLGAALKHLQVNKAYFITAVRDSSKYRKLRKQPHEQYSLHECAVGLDFPARSPQKLKWEIDRRHYMAEMQRGKGHHQ
jgi:hypothetical protein